MLLPKVNETTNLLCPTTPSVTHVALATVRMEPQFMILGQTAGTAAAIVCQDTQRLSTGAGAVNKDGETVQGVNRYVNSLTWLRCNAS